MRQKRRLSPEVISELREINSPNKYARVEEPTTRYNPKTPLRKEVPFGPTSDLENKVDLDSRLSIEEQRRQKPKAKIKLPPPSQRDRVRIIQAKILQNKIKSALKFNPDVFLSQNFEPAKTKGHGILIHPNGDIIKMKKSDDSFTHYDIIRSLGKQIGINAENPEEDHLEDFMKKTNTVRMNNTLGTLRAHIATPLTQSQIKTLKDSEIEYGDLHYAIGPSQKDLVFGEGVRNMLRDHAKMFGQRQAQEEDTNINMTYTKSKKTKLLKEMFRDQRTAKAEESIALFKQQKLGPEQEEGFGFDPRHGDFVTPQSARERYGKPGVALHFIATTDNAGPVENISRALDAIGENHFIGGWKSSTGFKTDASYIINTNDPQEVISHLKRHNQEASYSIDASGNPYFIRNPHFVKH